MSVPNEHANDSFNAVPLGGTLVMSPQPNVISYALRPDQFLTLCDGEMNEARSIRDACLGVFATGIVGIAGILLTIDWDAAVRQGRHPIGFTIFLGAVTCAGLIVALAEQRRITQTRTKSTYARLVRTIADYFKITI